MTRPTVSISFPSIYSDLVGRTLRNIRDAIRVPYEVIFVSPEPPPSDCSENVTWIEEPHGTGTGCNAGHAAAWKYMTGDFVIPWVDDHLFCDGVMALAIPNYEKREAEFHRDHKDKPFVLGLRHIWPHHVGTQFGIYYAYFPIVRREYIERVGWYDPAYRRGFADGDLALRIWAAGGRCEWSDNGLIQVDMVADNRKAGVMFDQADMDLFVERWAPKYGEGWATGHIRDFNIDIEPYHHQALVEGNSIYQNRPGYRDEVLAGGWRP